jgi:hypothetical protein
MEDLLAAVTDAHPWHFEAARRVMQTPLDEEKDDDDGDGDARPWQPPPDWLPHGAGDGAGDGNGDDNADSETDEDWLADPVEDAPRKRQRTRMPRSGCPQGVVSLEGLLVQVTAPHVATDVEAVTELVNQAVSPAHVVPLLLRWVVLTWSRMVPWAQVQSCAQCLTQVLFRFDALATPFGRKDVLYTLRTVGAGVRPWWEWFAAMSRGKVGGVVHRALAAWEEGPCAGEPPKTCGGSQ